MKRVEILIGGAATIALALAAWQNWLPFSVVEALGFITGAACVWLTVKQNIWTWPIGIANNIFFIVLFFQVQLYGDMGLQFVYIGLAVLGWYWWLHGGQNRGRLSVSRATPPTLAVLAVAVGLATFGLMSVLQAINGSAPFLDALTTTLSLAAQYMLTRKLLENWLVWITADILYIGLYAYKGLYLTGLLYFIFLCMCVAGYIRWRHSLAGQNPSRATKLPLDQPAEQPVEQPVRPGVAING